MIHANDNTITTAATGPPDGFFELRSYQTTPFCTNKVQAESYCTVIVRFVLVHAR
jgi:hypothetical protein